MLVKLDFLSEGKAQASQNKVLMRTFEFENTE
jgi:hypothetical protein